MTDEMFSRRRVLVIVNPAAGGGRGLRRFASRRHEIESWPVDLQIKTTAAPGDAEALATAATNVDLVVAVGGDGTVHEVVNGLLSSSAPPPPLAILPVGTACDFARNLGSSAVRAGRMPSQRIAVDVGRASVTLGPAQVERFFVNAANMGASTAASRRVNDSVVLRRVGAAAYVLAGLPEILSRPAADYAWLNDGRERRTERLLNLSVCNGARFGGGLCLAPAATLTDHLLHVARIATRSHLGLLRTLAAGYADRAAPPPGVRVNSTRTITIEGDGPVELDGELLGTLPATFSIVPGGLDLLV